jgi:hypothetical protein
MALTHNFCLGKLRSNFVPLAFNFKYLNKIDVSFDFFGDSKLVSSKFYQVFIIMYGVYACFVLFLQAMCDSG